MVGRDTVLENGGEVVAIPLVEGFSTSSIVRRMRAPNDLFKQINLN